MGSRASGIARRLPAPRFASAPRGGIIGAMSDSDPFPSGANGIAAAARLMTLRGEVVATEVHAWDKVLTLSGRDSPLKPIAALGRVEIDLDAHPAAERAAPVRIRAGAIDEEMPVRDLLVSPGLALGIEDENGERVLVPALYLVNGATILREPAAGIIVYVPIAMAEHDLLMADGMPVESTFGGQAVVQADKVVPLTRARSGPAPDFPDLLPRPRDAESCFAVVPREDVVVIHARMLARAEAQGWTLTDEPALAVTADGVTLEPLSAGAGEFVFLIPEGLARIGISSRLRVPSDLDPFTADRRRLGVALLRIVVDGEEIALDDPRWGGALLPMERDGEQTWRWTTGEVDVPLEPGETERTLEITIAEGWGRYWLPPG